MSLGRVVAICLVVLVLGTGCSSDAAIAPAQAESSQPSAQVEAPSTASSAAPQGVLLVQEGVLDRGPFLALAPDGTELATIEAPAGYGAFYVARVLHAAKSPIAIVQAPPGLVTLDLATFEAKTLLPDATVEWVTPDERYAVVKEEAMLSILDTTTGELTAVVPGERVVDFVVAGDFAMLRILAGARWFIVDLSSGRVTERADLSGGSLSDTGDRAFFVRRSALLGNRERELVVFDTANPDQEQVWATDAGLVTYAWDQEEIIAAQWSGQVSLLTADGATDIGSLLVGDPARTFLLIHPNPLGPGALIQVGGADTRTWHYFDSASRLLSPLPTLEGMETSATMRAPQGYGILDDRTDGSHDVSLVRSVSLADGTVVELVSSDGRQVRTGTGIGHGLATTGRPGEPGLRITDLITGASFEIGNAGFALAGPDGSHIAATVPSASGQEFANAVAIVSSAGADQVTIAEGLLIDWLDTP